MKKFVLTISTTLLFVLYIFYERGNTPQTAMLSSATDTVSVNTAASDNAAAGSAPPSQTASPAASIAPRPTDPQPAAALAPKPTPAPTPAPAPAKAPVKVAGAYNDGTYTGDSVDAYYGMVQVEAIISNGKIINVKFLSYPSDRETSQQISSMATPILASEAIQKQSANVSIVSGATDTSQAFRQSLASALIKAKN